MFSVFAWNYVHVKRFRRGDRTRRVRRPGVNGGGRARRRGVTDLGQRSGAHGYLRDRTGRAKTAPRPGNIAVCPRLLDTVRTTRRNFQTSRIFHGLKKKIEQKNVYLSIVTIYWITGQETLIWDCYNRIGGETTIRRSRSDARVSCTS